MEKIIPCSSCMSAPFTFADSLPSYRRALSPDGVAKWDLRQVNPVSAITDGSGMTANGVMNYCYRTSSSYPGNRLHVRQYIFWIREGNDVKMVNTEWYGGWPYNVEAKFVDARVDSTGAPTATCAQVNARYESGTDVPSG
jgi:hypothetical protein